MYRTIFLSLILFLYGCGSIPRDTSPAPIDNNLFTAEIAGCHGVNLGLAGCYYSSKADTTDKFLSLKLFHKGEYEIKSNKCSFNKTQTYVGNQTVKIPIDELIAYKPDTELSCVFDIKVFVEGLDRGFRGMFVLINKENLKTTSADFKYGSSVHSFFEMGSLQIKKGSQLNGSLNFKSEDPGEIVWVGCEITGEKKFKSNPELKLEEVFQKELTVGKSCILEIGIVYNDPLKQPEIFTFNIQIFDESVLPLADPIVEIDGSKVKVTADPLVAVIGLDNQYCFNKNRKKGVAKFKKVSDDFTLRLVTSNGRYNLYRILNGKVVWKPLIVY